MSQAQTNSLDLDRRQSRFIDPETEQQYRSWRINEARSSVRVLFAVSIIGWILVSAAPVMMRMAGNPLDEVKAEQLFWLVYGTIIPILALGVWLSTAWRWGYERLITGFGLAYVGCTAQWLTLVIMPSASGAVGFAAVFAYSALVMRLNPLTTTLSISPFMCMATYTTYWLSGQGEISTEDILWNYGLLACIYIFIITISLASERFLRRAYCNERLIEQQQKTLENNQKLIRRYVPAAVADHITEGKGEHIDAPQRRRVTILFSDIVGFTDMADRLDAESLTQVLNEYMAAMADLVEQHGGTLNEFSGDGLMAVFGAPNEMEPEDQAINAVKAAQEMQARLPDLNEGWLKLGIGEPMQIRIGINTGVLSVGSFGSEGRMTYTAIGLQTNIAARIQSHCEPGGILLSDASWHLVKDKIDCVPKGEVECKGVHFPVKVYAPRLPT